MYSVQSTFGLKRLNVLFLGLAALMVANSSIAGDKTDTLFTQFKTLNTNASNHLYLGNTLLFHQGIAVKCCSQCKDNNGKDCFYVTTQNDKTIILNDTQVVTLCTAAQQKKEQSSSSTSTSIPATTQPIKTPTNVATAIIPQTSKLADYNLVITAGAAGIGTLAEQIAKRKFETSDKKAFTAGIAATSAASLFGQSLQQDKHTAKTVLTQLVIDYAVYTAVHHATNFFYPPAKKGKTAQDAVSLAATNSPATPALPKTTQNRRCPLLLFPKSRG